MCFTHIYFHLGWTEAYPDDISGDVSDAPDRKKRRFSCAGWGWIVFILFLLMTAVMAFLWNIPLNNLAVEQEKNSPLSIRLNGQELPHEITEFARPMIEHFAAHVINAGRIDFSDAGAAEVEIRLGTFTVLLDETEAVFHFQTKTGGYLQTRKTSGSYERHIYQWIKATER